MKRLPIVIAVLLFASCGTSTTETMSTPEASISSSELVKEIISNYDAEREAFMAAYRAANTPAEKQQIRDELNPDAEEFAGELLEIASENPNDPAAFDALSWVVTNVGRGEMADLAMDRLFENHIDRPEMKQVCVSVSRGLPSPKIEKRLGLLISESPHKEVKGTATYSLAEYLARLPDLVEFADDPRMSKMLGEDNVAYLKNFVHNEERVEELYTSVINDYADVLDSRDKPIGERAESALFALRHLGIGKVAPEIEGVDLDGESFKLSEYRGKVVMLDFWGDW